MQQLTKIELLYYLYRFGCKRHIVNINPLVVFPVDNIAIPLTFNDFKIAFKDACTKWNYTEDFVYSRCKDMIDVLIQNQQFNFNLE